MKSDFLMSGPVVVVVEFGLVGSNRIAQRRTLFQSKIFCTALVHLMYSNIRTSK